MGKIFELFGMAPNEFVQQTKSVKHECRCPYTQSTCDGGGNRHQTAIRIEGTELESIFTSPSNNKKIVPGICSITSTEQDWVVCPRRLFGFQNTPTQSYPTSNYSLQDHEAEALKLSGLPLDVELGVWPEVYLKSSTPDSIIKYHFDFVIAPILRDCSLDMLPPYFDASEIEGRKRITAAAKAGGYTAHGHKAGQTTKILPDLSEPFIIEVMTASTSGSNKAKGTDISTAFRNAATGRSHQSPGINKRQVWGRMATQLYAKSHLASAWGGKTIWIVQDELLNNISSTTGLRLIDHENEYNTINFVSMSYKENSSSLSVDNIFRIPMGISAEDSDRATMLLLPKFTPSKSALLEAVLRRPLAAVIKLT